MKDKVKTIFVSVFLTTLCAVGIIYAKDITKITDPPAEKGDKLTHTWVNAVNTALSAGASGGSPWQCSVIYNSISDKHVGHCINVLTGRVCKMPDIFNYTIGAMSWTCKDATGLN